MRTLFLGLGVGLGLGLLLLGAGCTLNHKQVEDSIKKDMTSKGITLKTIECPSGRSKKAGESFDCNATDDDGHDATFHVVVGQGKYEWTTDSMSVEEDVVGHELEKGMNTAGTAIVTCPAKKALMKQGQSFQCSVANTKAKSVLITKGANKVFTWQLID